MRRFELLILPFLLLLSSSVSRAYIVISDLDDTIKITHSECVGDAFYRGLFSRKAFTGMQELFWGFAEQTPNGLYVVSGSPTLIKGIVKDFISFNRFPDVSISLRNWFREYTAEYKTRVIEDILRKTGEQAILMGDDTEHDPAILTDIQKRFPDRILATYIHIVSQKTLPQEPIRKFLSAWEIASQEYKDQRISHDAVTAVGDALLMETKDKRIVPKFLHCKAPIDLECQSNQGDVSLMTYCLAIEDKLSRLCLK